MKLFDFIYKMSTGFSTGFSAIIIGFSSAYLLLIYRLSTIKNDCCAIPYG